MKFLTYEAWQTKTKTHEAKLVFVYLATQADNKNLRTCIASRKEISNACSMDIPRVARAISELQDLKVLRKLHVKNKGSLYKIEVGL